MSLVLLWGRHSVAPASDFSLFEEAIENITGADLSMPRFQQ